MSVVGTSGNDTLLGTGGDDFIYGQAGDDSLSGLAGNDDLEGGSGNDVLDGGPGIDFAEYFDATGAVFVSLLTGLATGASGNDTLMGIENLSGSQFNDSLTGDGGSNDLFGEQGNDTLLGGAGNDFLFGDDGNDLLDAGAGDDVLTGGAGNDFLDGGAGVDMADYFDAVAVVAANLLTGAVSGGSGNDTLTGIENIYGSTHNDTLVGDGGSNVLSGSDGNDSIDGGAGDDFLDGGDGNDTLVGGTGFNNLHGGAGDDVLVGGTDRDEADFNDATSGVNANLVTGLATGGAGNDTMSGIENLFGSDYTDTLTGDAGDNNLFGWMGDDTLAGGAGNDFLYGGDGNDTLDAGTGLDNVDGGDGTDLLVLGLTRASYQVSHPAAGVTQLVNVAANVAVSFSNVENIQFSDGTVPVAALAGNQSPVVNTGGDILSTAEDTPLTFTAAQFLAGFSDPDGDPMTVNFSGVTEIVDHHDGTYTYTPPKNFKGTAFSAGLAVISDNQGGSISVQVQFNVTPVNHAPVFAGDFNGVATIGNDSAAFDSNVIALPGGKLVASLLGNDFSFIGIAQLNPDGTPDLAYGTNGLATFSLPGYALGDGLNPMAADSNGRLVYATSYTSNSGDGYIAMRFNTDGTLDTTFNGGLGYTRLDIGDGEFCRGMVIDTAGRILISGWSRPNSSPDRDVQVVRLNSNGTLDTSYGNGGVATVVAPGDDRIDSLTALPDGSVFAVGRGRDAGNVQYAAILKFTPGGALDTSFNGTGRLLLQPPGMTAPSIHSLVVQNDGALVIAGFGSPGTGNSVNDWVGRLHADGSVDTSFNGNGWYFSSLQGAGSTGIWNLALENGKILAFGDAQPPDNSFGSYALRLNGNGTADTSFGNNGYVRITSSSSNVQQALFGDGSMVVVSETMDAASGTGLPALTRLLANGSVDKSFNPSPDRTVHHSAQPFTVTGAQLLRGWADPDAGDTLHLASVTADHGNVQVSGSGATAVYTITPANAYSGPLAVNFTVSDNHGGSANGSQVFTVVNAPPKGALTIAGNPAQGQVLATTNNLSDADGLGALSLQWNIDGAPIGGATSSTLSVTPDLAGHLITVTASYVDGLGTHESVTSRAVTAGGIFIGGAGNDSLVGTAGPDLMDGGAGNDTLVSGGGSDSIDGGDGSDVVRFSGNFSDYVITGGSTPGNMTVTGPDGGVALLTHVESLQFQDRTLAFDFGTQNNDVLTVAPNEGPTLVDGGAGNDVITANDSGNALLGGEGNDQLHGGLGTDNLDGGTGNDTMTGGAGDDIYVVDSPGDVVVEGGAAQSADDDKTPRDINLGGGIDKVVASINYTLGSFVENLTLADGAGNLSGTGNSLNNVLVGNAGNNAFSAGAGNDTITGGAGNDTIDGGPGRDTAIYNGTLASYAITVGGSGRGNVTISGGDGVDVLANVERARFDDFGMAFDINGNAGDAYRLYQAAFARTPDIGGVGFQMNQLDLGRTLASVAADFLASPEFQAKYGNVSDSAYVVLLYQNVLHRTPVQEEIDFHVDHELHAGYSRAQELTFFSDSPENKANVIGAIQNGIIYSL